MSSINAQRHSAKRQGIFVTFEGGEGSGKSTQIKLLAQWLQKEGFRVIDTREPGGTPVADQIRKILLDQKNQIPPHRELFLYEVARRDHVMEVIRPALKRRVIVLCDRFTDATVAYQGYGRSLPLPLIEALNETATGGLKPDLTFLIDLPVTVGLKRSRRRLQKRGIKEGRFEAEKISFHKKVRSGYLTLASKEKRRFRVIDGRGSEEEVFHRIQKAWRNFHGRRKVRRKP